MADDKKKPKPTRIITPKFLAMYAWLSSPNTKHDKDGAYQVSGIFDPKNPEHRAFLGQLKKIHTDNVAESRKAFKSTKKQPEMKVTPCMHEDEEKPGLFRVNFKESAFIDVDDKENPGKKKRINLKPAAVDAKGQPFDAEVWSGSSIKVAVDVAPFYNGSLGAGLSLRLKGVQVLTLCTRGSRDGASLGFGVEDGFDASGFGGGAAEGSATPHTEDDDEFNSDDNGEATPEEAGATAPVTDADNYDF